MVRRIVLVCAAGLALVALLLVVTLSAPASANAAGGLTRAERLGKALFFDKNLSLNGNQSCASCHAPQVGWTGPDQATNQGGAVYQGSIAGAFGDRKPPAAAYAGDSPILHFGDAWTGGMFWDGRASGWRLGDPLAEQAQGPFLNPAEQAMPDAQAVVDKVLVSNYKDLFLQVCGTAYDVPTYYECIGRSIAAYERSSEVSAFTSKYDYYLKGKAKLTPQEKQGLILFNGKAKCASCHVEPLFTDFTYDNLGLPKNPKNPVYARNPSFVDPGLGGFLKSAGYDYEAEWGKHKVPTLRNVDKRPNGSYVKAYGHNGYFKSLEEIIHFYNTRDVPGAGWHGKPWPAPEVSANVNTTELGNLGLSPAEERALIAFLKTLSDGYKP